MTEVAADALLIDVAGPAPLVIGTDVLKPIEDGGRLVKLDDGWGWRAAGVGMTLSVSPVSSSRYV